jgi:hypothetical protein
MISDAMDCRRQLEDTVNDEPEIKSLWLSPNDWKELSDIKKILQPFNEYTEYVSRNSPSIHIVARLFEELYTTLQSIKERQRDWQKVSAAITVTISDNISVLEEYYDYVKGNDIYYIASVLDPRIKTRWLKTLPYGDEVIDRIKAFLKRAYPSEIQPESTASNIAYKSLEYRFLEAFQPAQNLTGQTDIDRYFDTPTITTGFDANQSQTDYIRDWWMVNKVEFNCMAKVAQDYLAIPAAEVDIERLFSRNPEIEVRIRFESSIFANFELFENSCGALGPVTRPGGRC